MVLKRRLDYRLNGYNFPSFPCVPISAKGKRSVRKRNLEDRMCAFDLLAAVADKLFEKENSATHDVPGSSISNSKMESKEHLDSTLELSGTSFVSLCSGSSNQAKGEEGSSVSGKVGVGKNIAENVKMTQSLECQGYGIVIDGSPSGCYSLDGPLISDVKPPLTRSESSPEVHNSRDIDSYNSSFPHSWDGLELPVHRDDDENYSRCTLPCTSTNKSSMPKVNRLRRLFASRYWKVDLDSANPTEPSKTVDVDLKPAFRRKKISCTHQRPRRISFKRRKLLERHSVSASHNGFRRVDVLNLLKKKILDVNSSASLSGVNTIPSTITEQLSSYKPEDFCVKLSIKSFIIPELFIEIPETATIGSLKRTAMEAITSIIGSGLHVGVLLQGEKFRDDDRTLIQAGISNANELDELSFTLEPSSSLSSPQYSNSEKPHFVLHCESTKPLTRLSAGTSDQGRSDSFAYPASLSRIFCHEREHDSVHSPSNTPSLGRTASCQGLDASSVLSVEALSVVPVCNPRTSEAVQRRIRRPFTVSEVEALVRAVEELGTGRWRDVKLRSFDGAEHRTYVDLKDKWKTLVHTARITPRQRRGEPVPQELLDRVLRAHAEWSQQQANPSSSEACLGL